jgi:hypothetical protein
MSNTSLTERDRALISAILLRLREAFACFGLDVEVKEVNP